MNEKFLRANLFIGAALILASTVLLVLELPFMKTWFYNFAWWPFILVADSLNYRRTRSSPLFRSMGNLVFLALASVFIWLIFELINLRLNNWSYNSLPLSRPGRWLGFFIAFASVLPALLELSVLFQSLLKGKKLRLFRIPQSVLFLKGCVGFGAISLVLSLAQPHLFFPLVWLAFIFILEPVNYWLGNDTFLGDTGENNWTRFWSWAAAGFTAGVLWECWNFWAGSHWEYALPYFDFLKVFQMPALGYSGFLPFALEVFAFSSFLAFLWRKLSLNRRMQILICCVLLLLYGVCFYLIDEFTVAWIPLK